jgi:hypothetical protein
MTSTSRGSEGDFAGVGRPLVGGQSGPGRSDGDVTNTQETRTRFDRVLASEPHAHRGDILSNGASHVKPVSSTAPPARARAAEAG